MRRSRETLESICGRRVIGFRAPSFSIVPGLEWALEILLQEGYGYDSSLFPITRRGYGYPRAGRDPYWINCPTGTLIEMPPATLRRFGMNLPAAGGGYLRLLPLGLMRSAIDATERRNAPATLYIHPWEIDPDQPRLNVSLKTRIRHYGGLDRTMARLSAILGSYPFRPVADTYARVLLVEVRDWSGHRDPTPRLRQVGVDRLPLVVEDAETTDALLARLTNGESAR